MARSALDQTEKLMLLIAGKPRAAIVTVWPVLDSQCMASVILINRNRAKSQKLPVQVMEMEFEPDEIRWTFDAGFINGYNAHGKTPSEALLNLYAYLIERYEVATKVSKDDTDRL